MKIAFLIQCHKNPEQIKKLINALSHDNIDIYIHVDKKSSIKEKLKQNDEKIFFIDDKYRCDVKWGTYSQVEATLSLLKAATNKGIYDYYWLISGQDFPLVPSTDIVEFFSKNEYEYINLFNSKNNGCSHTNNYDKRNEIVFSDWMFKRDLLHRIIRRSWVGITGGYNHTFTIFKRKNNLAMNFYFGSSWWCLSGKLIDYIMKYLSEHPEYEKFYRNTSCPDESFFQTLVMNSPFAKNVKEYLHYIDWSEGNSSPKNLTISDIDSMFSSKKMMARKIDSEIDNKIINEILARIKAKEE